MGVWQLWEIHSKTVCRRVAGAPRVWGVLSKPQVLGLGSSPEVSRVSQILYRTLPDFRKALLCSLPAGVVLPAMEISTLG